MTLPEEIRLAAKTTLAPPTAEAWESLMGARPAHFIGCMNAIINRVREEERQRIASLVLEETGNKILAERIRSSPV